MRVGRVGFLLAAAMWAVPAAAKGPIHGLVTMNSLAFLRAPGISPDNSLPEARAHPGIYAGAVVAAAWDQLEPERGRFDFSSIDAGLEAIRAYNAAHPAAPMVAKLRVFAGPRAPAWAKSLGGGPLTLRKRERTGSFGAFWSVPYRQAWAELQVALAARYDSNPLLAEVAVSSCASVTAEPFIVLLGPDNREALEAAGYSNAAMEDCLMHAPDDYAPWKQTAVDYTFNPWREIEGGRLQGGGDFAEQVMDRFRRLFGARGVIANHGLAPEMNPPAEALLAEMHRLGPPIEFQTRSPDEDWDAAVARGEQVGMTELEVWNTRAAGGPAPVTETELRAWRQQLAR